jgi:hypothetical protein
VIPGKLGLAIMNKLRRSFLFTVLVALVLTLAGGALADDWTFTGSAVRTKAVGPFTFKVYAIRHDMKGKVAKNKQAVIDADVDKKFTWKMLRDVDSDKIRDALREAFTMNGYHDQSKINPFVAAFNKEEVKEDSAIVISYDAKSKTTSIWVQNGSRAAVPGEDFMKAVWRIWFGKIDQPSMGDQLIARMPS